MSRVNRPAWRSAAELADARAGERVLVFGSLPPAGRDVDLLARPPAEAAIATGLAEAGFLNRDEAWVRFGADGVAAVDLAPAASWQLPDGELEELFDLSRPLPGFAHLAEPAPEHRLLILARRLQDGGVLSHSRRQRVRRALAEDPDAWERAAARQDGWGAVEALPALRDALHGEDAPGPLRRARLAAWRLHRRRIVTLSGIDGSGKSSQAEALRKTLEQLGHEAAIVWTPLANDAWLDRLARPVKRLVWRLGARRSGRSPGPGEEPPSSNRGSAMRHRSRLANAAWSTLVAAVNGWAHARLTLHHVRRGRVVICDRYVLDSVVRLRFLYGERRPLRLQRALVRLLSPASVVSVYLDVPAAESLARKDDGWLPDELETLVRLYRDEHERAGALRLDGTRPFDELAGEIAALVWRRLD